MKKTSIHELSIKTIEALLILGMQTHTACNEYGKSYIQIEKFFEEHGQAVFDRATMDKFVCHTQQRLADGNISCSHYNKLKLAAERITELHDTGKLEWTFRGSDPISRKGSGQIRKLLHLVMVTHLRKSPPNEPVYQFLDRKRSEGKPFLVYMTAGANKFLRIYYARVKEHLLALDNPE